MRVTATVLWYDLHWVPNETPSNKELVNNVEIHESYDFGKMDNGEAPDGEIIVLQCLGTFLP